MEHDHCTSKIIPDCKQQIAYNEKIKEEIDGEDLLERCWTEEYKGASRKWLIRDSSVYLPKEPVCSTMKQSFQIPNLCPKKQLEAKNIGKKREILLKQFREEATAEILEEQKAAKEPLDYCSEYDGNFKAEGFSPDDQHYIKNTDLNNTYPLYSSPSISYYSFNQDKKKEAINGLTKITDKRNIFKRNSQFSTPTSQSFYAYEM